MRLSSVQMRTKTQEKAILLVTDPDKITADELMRQVHAPLYLRGADRMK